MLAALLLQGSLLVAPMELGDLPPVTTAVAAIRFKEDDRGFGVAEAQTWADRAQAADGFVEQARRWSLQGDERVKFAVYGTHWLGTVPREVGYFLMTADVGEVRNDEWYLVAQRLERDAACRQIFVAGTDDNSRSRADAILRELRAGADFAAIARERSDDRASALRGGDLGIYERSPRDALLREAIFQAKVGEIIGPLESPLGFHILQRVAVDELDPRLREDVWARGRAILVAFGGSLGADPALVREQTEAQVIADQLAARIRGGEDMAKVAAEFNDDRGGRERAGDIGWLRRATTTMPQFFDRLFLEPPGTLIGPIASNAGFVILRREDPGPRSRIDLRLRAFVDLEQWVRKLAESKTELPALEGLEPAVAAARALDASFRSPLEWGRIEGHLIDSPSAADFARHCESLPESVTSISGRPVALRELALAYAKALVALEPTFTAVVWPEHERVINVALLQLKLQIATLGDVALDELIKGLGVEDPREIVPVYVVAEGPWPGGVTHRGPNGGVCLIDADENAGTQLIEIVLHESSHALDVATQGRETALSALRERMQAAGIDPRDRSMRDVPHTLMFVTSAWVVRQVFDPAHVDYGDVAGYYAKVPAAIAAVRAPWTAFLDGKKTREGALDAIVEAVKPAK